MRLHPPFIISARLAPALRIGDVTISLVKVGPGPDRRSSATMVMDFPDGRSYEDANLQSGCWGFSSTVAIFETYLSFLSAALESRAYQTRTGRKGDHADLFPAWVLDQFDGMEDDVDCARSDLCDEDDGCTVHENLIEET